MVDSLTLCFAFLYSMVSVLHISHTFDVILHICTEWVLFITKITMLVDSLTMCCHICTVRSRFSTKVTILIGTPTCIYLIWFFISALNRFGSLQKSQFWQIAQLCIYSKCFVLSALYDIWEFFGKVNVDQRKCLSAAFLDH